MRVPVGQLGVALFGKAGAIGGTHASYSAHADYSEDFVLWVMTEFAAAPPFACRYELLEAFVEIGEGTDQLGRTEMALLSFGGLRL